MRTGLSAVTALLAAFLACLPGVACTDFQVKTTKSDVFIGRSMEWGADLNSRLVVHPRGEKRTSPGPGGKPGLSWTSKLGYVGVDANGLDVSVDGLNEKGLSFGLLWFPGYTKYQNVSPEQANTALDVTELGAWVLGNFETVDQVKAAIGGVRVCGNDVPSFGGTPTAHMALHDATGNNLVVEFVNGEQKIYDNKIGVLTNSPTFDWHQINLANFVFVRSENAGAVKIAGMVLAPPGQGSGLLGIPGDWTPPSRFVRTAAMLTLANPVDTPKQGVSLTEHVLNAVDIPRGTIKETVGTQVFFDYTQWAVIKDLSNKEFYFRSYDSLGLRMLDLKKLNFEPNAKKLVFPFAGGELAQEVKAN
jgi:choloylglycine hydrolase